MAVAAADFYTYARATGTPLPQNKKEEAELVPAINQWKRNQLRQQRQEENNINGGAIAAVAGLAGLGAAALAASRGGLRTRVTNAVDPTSGSRISTGVGGLQQDLNEKVTQSRDWDDYRDSITLKTQLDERDFVNEALDKVERDAIRQSSLADYTPQELAALEQATPRVSEKVRRANIREGGEKVRQNMIRGLELPEPSWEQTSVVQNRQPEVRAISPKEVLALPSAITDEGYTAPQKTWSEYRYAGPDALESLADEQLDIIRGTSPTGGSAIENAERSAELNRQAQMRRSLPAEGGQKVLRDLFAKPQVADPWDTPAITNNDVNSPITTNDFLQKEGPGKYIDPELVTNNSVANVPKSTTTQDQAISAINSAEDQDTGRIRDAIVKDPNIDTSNLDDANLQNISQNLPVTQEEQRLGVSKEQDFVEQALAKTRPTYAEELNRDELKALEGIDWELKKSRKESQPKFYEGRNINIDRVENTKPLKTGTFLDNYLGALPGTLVLADEVARRGVKDVADAARSIKKAVVENAPSNLPDLSRVPTAGTNTSATVQLSDGSTAGPLYPFRQLVRGLTGDESVDVVTPRPNAQELLDKTKGEIIRVEGPQGQVRYAETRPDPSWVGAKSDIPTNTPVPGPDLSQTELSRVLQRQRYEIASNLRKKGEPITPGKIESELEKFYGPESYDYVRNELKKDNVKEYTKRKHALQLGATYDPKFFDDVDLDSVQIAGENIPVIPSRRFTEAKTPYTGKAYLDDYSDSLKTPFYSEDTALRLAEQVEKKKNWGLTPRAEVESDIAEIYKERKQIAEQQGKEVAAQLKIAESKGQIGLVNKLSNQLTNIRKVWKDPSLGMHRQGDIRLAEGRLRGIARKEIEMQGEIANLTVPLTVGELPENAGKRVYYETDTTGGKGQKIGKQLPDVDLADEVVDDIDRIRTPMIDPESVELRSEYRIKDTELKGSGGRKQAEALSPRPDNPLDTLVPLQPRGTGEGLLDSRRFGRQTTRPVIDAIEPDRGVTDTGGLELAPRIYEDEQGGVTDIYGRRLASDLKDSDTARPTQMVGKVKGPQTQKPTAAMRGQSGTRAVNIAENIRHLSDPNWLASQGYSKEAIANPQAMVKKYLQRLQNKYPNETDDLQNYIQTRGQSRPATYQQNYTNLRGEQPKNLKLKPEQQPNIIGGEFQTPLQWLEKRKRKN